MAHTLRYPLIVLTVSTSGFVTDAKIDTSSGHRELDEAAIYEAKRSWRLRPGTVDGRPVTMQYKFKVAFKNTGN